MKIDSHQHFWWYNAQEYGWIGPELSMLRRDFLPHDLAPLLKQSGIGGSVSVQARQTLAETQWLLDLSDEHPFIRGVVGWVDLCSPRVEEQLERFAAHPRFRGVRHVLQDEPDDRFALRDDFLRGIGGLAQYRLTYDILVFPRQLPAALELAQRFPEQPFVVDHIAKPPIITGKIDSWNLNIRRLAQHENIYCKVSGLATEADWKHWKKEDFAPYLDVVFECFGTKRIMLGSDWPVCTAAGEYAEIMRIPADFIEQLSSDEQADVWGTNAKRFYRLE
ncbi:MAG: amidohydrolase family protein [Candidatus Omnitrophota bacterium]